LSESLVTTAASAEKQKKLKENQKAIVEMNNEKYLVVTLKSDRSRIGVCILQNFNTTDIIAQYQRYKFGDEIEVRLIEDSSRNEGDFLLMTPKQALKVAHVGGPVSLEEGARVNGTLKSIKGQCAFIQVGSNGKVPIIGRLHRVEMQESKKSSEFESLKPGDKIEAKVLRKIQDGGRTFIELTRRKEHLALDEGLVEGLLKLLSLDTLKEG